MFGLFTTVKKVDTKVLEAKHVVENEQPVSAPVTTPETKPDATETAPDTTTETTSEKTPVTAPVAAPQVTETFASWDSDM